MEAVLELEPGTYNFTGAMNLTVKSGVVEIRGAVLKEGFTGNVIMPFYALPDTMYVKDAATILVKEIPREYFLESEYQYFYPEDAMENYEKIFDNLFYNNNGVQGVEYPEEFHATVSKILDGPPSKIFCIGALGSGKSTLSRFVVNRVLTKYDHVYYLDLDGGQSEIRFPGAVSLSRFDSFYLSCPGHPTVATPIDTRIIGGCRVNNPLYFQSLIALVDQLPKDGFIVINSHGWVEDMGRTIHSDMIKLLEPDHILHVHREGHELEPFRMDQINICTISKNKSMSINAPEYRTLRIESHLMRQRPAITLQQPIALDLSKVRIGVYAGYLERSRLPMLLSGSLVFLCRDHRTYKKEITKRMTMVVDRASLTCYGIGIVKAVDIENGLLYVVTPDPVDNVNMVVYQDRVAEIPPSFFKGNSRPTQTYSSV